MLLSDATFYYIYVHIISCIDGGNNIQRRRTCDGNSSLFLLRSHTYCLNSTHIDFRRHSAVAASHLRIVIGYDADTPAVKLYRIEWGPRTEHTEVSKLYSYLPTPTHSC